MCLCPCNISLINVCFSPEQWRVFRTQGKMLLVLISLGKIVEAHFLSSSLIHEDVTAGFY